MLRLWPTGEPQTAWRASLEDPHTHNIQHFNTLDDLCDYLRELRFLEHSESNTPKASFNHQVP